MVAFTLTSRAFLCRLGLLAAATAALSGCQSIQGISPTSPQVRLVDAVPNQSKGLDFYLNKNAEAYNLGFATSSNYIPLSSGAYTASVVANGTTQILASTGFTAADNNHYTVLAGNVPAQMEVNTFVDQSTPAPTGQVDVRFLDQSQNAGALDIYFIPEGGKLTTTNPAIVGLTFDANSGYIPIPVGTYEIAIVPTGTIPISTTVTLLTDAQVTYNAGDARTFVIYDMPLVTTPAVGLMKLTDYGN